MYKTKIVIEASVPNCYSKKDIIWAFLKAFEKSDDLSDTVYCDNIYVEEMEEIKEN